MAAWEHVPMHLGRRNQAALHLAAGALGEVGGAMEASVKAGEEEVGVGKVRVGGALWRGQGLWVWLEWWVKVKLGFAPIEGDEGGALSEIYPWNCWKYEPHSHGLPLILGAD